jgi:hypothetical protein
MMYRVALPVLALLVAGACSERNPISPGAGAALATIVERDAERSGYLHAVKNCENYHGLAGQSCTLTSTSLKQIPAGSLVTYASALVGTPFESDIIIYPPGPGNSVAFGHVYLDLVTRTGVATINGGTGQFKHFSATITITKLATINGRDWSWDGPYSFNNRGDEDLP